MGRRKNNPALVEELIDNLWEMQQDEFEDKYYSLSSSDRYQVDEAIDGMEDELMNRINDYDEEDDDCGESYSIEDCALAWASRGCDEDGFGEYTAEELEEVLHRRY